MMQARQDLMAFGVLYQRYIDRIYAYIYHRVGNVQDTEDLMARTFYRALDKLDTYDNRGPPFSAIKSCVLLGNVHQPLQLIRQFMVAQQQNAIPSKNW